MSLSRWQTLSIARIGKAMRPAAWAGFSVVSKPGRAAAAEVSGGASETALRVSSVVMPTSRRRYDGARTIVQVNNLRDRANAQRPCEPGRRLAGLDRRDLERLPQPPPHRPPSP